MHELLEQASAVFFDLDGTLVDSVNDIHNALNQALFRHKLAQVSKIQVHSWIGRGAKVLVEFALEYAQPDRLGKQPIKLQTVLDSFLEIYQVQACKYTKVYNGVLPLLDALQQSNKHMACITNKPLRPALTVIETLGLSDYFSLILGGDCLAKKKPHPLPLQHALSYYAINPTDAVMVGDSQFDMMAAQAANIPCIGVLGGYNHGIPLEESNPTLTVPSFTALH